MTDEENSKNLYKALAGSGAPLEDIDEKYKFGWKEFLSLKKTYHVIYHLKG